MFSPPKPHMSALEQQLRQDRHRLICQLREKICRSGDPVLAPIAKLLAEADDWQVADLLTDAAIIRSSAELEELRSIDLALHRIAKGAYGLCVDCERPLEPSRLDLLPAARQCQTCKKAFEQRRGIVN